MVKCKILIMKVNLFILMCAVVVKKVFGECRPESLRFIGLQEKIFRSVAITITVDGTKCPGKDTFYNEWVISEKDNGRDVQRTKGPSITIKGYNFNHRRLFEKKFIIRVTVSHNSDMSLSSSKSEEFVFLPDEPHIEIVGGNHVFHPAKADLIVDARTLSHDRTFTNEEFPLNDKVQWSVLPNTLKVDRSDNLKLKISGEQLNAGEVYTFTLEYITERTAPLIRTYTQKQVVSIIGKQFFVQCRRNCINANPAETTILKVVCFEKCKDHNYVWESVPSIPKSQIDFGTGTDKFLAKHDSFKPGQNVTFTAKANGEESSIYVKFSDLLPQGECEINPTEGTSETTKFEISCMGFFSMVGMKHCMLMQEDNETGVNMILISKGSIHRNEVYLSAGSPARVLIDCVDNHYVKSSAFVTAKVNPSKMSNKQKIDNIYNKLFSKPSKIENLISKPDSNDKFFQAVNIMLETLQKTQIKTDTKKHIHHHLSDLITRITPTNQENTQQYLSVIKKLAKLRDPVDVQTASNLGKALSNTNKYLKKVITEQEDGIPAGDINNFANYIMNTTAELLNFQNDINDLLAPLNRSYDYESYDDLVKDKAIVTSQLEELTDALINTTENAARTLLNGFVKGGSAIKNENDLGKFINQKTHPMDLRDKIISVDNTSSFVKLPHEILVELQEKFDSIEYQIGQIHKNPYWYEKNSSHLNTDVVMFDLYKDGIPIGTLNNSFEVFLRTHVIPYGTIQGILNDTDPIMVYRFKIEPGALLAMSFKQNESTIQVTTSTCYCGREDFVNGIRIDNRSTNEQRMLKFFSTHKNNVVYVCVMKIGSESANYSVYYSSFSCLHRNLTTGSWDRDYCIVRDASLASGSFLHCQCTHKSLFVGEIFVPPNKINAFVDIEFEIFLIKNWLMLIFVAFLLTILVLSFFWAYIKDRRFEDHNFICRLVDNHPGDSHLYLVVVFTGVFLDAGTTADVAFQIIGDKSRSRVHLMKCCCGKLLQRNAQDWYIMFTPLDLGKIKSIKLWHNTRGYKPHWFCERIIVLDVKSGEQYCFLVDKWFSLVWGNGNIYHKVQVSPEKDLASPKVLLRVKIGTGIKDKHIWISLFLRDAQSIFTTKERVGCAFAGLFLSMLASAMFYGIPEGKPVDSIETRSGLSIHYTDVAIFIESLLVTVPASILLIILFRNSNPEPKQRTNPWLKKSGYETLLGFKENQELKSDKQPSEDKSSQPKPSPDTSMELISLLPEPEMQKRESLKGSSEPASKLPSNHMSRDNEPTVLTT